MRIRCLHVAALSLALLFAACGDDADSGAQTREGPTTSGFTESHDTDLAELSVVIDDPDEAEAVYEELVEVEGWIGSSNTSGATTLRFVPYPEALDAAIASQRQIEETLSEHGSVQTTPYTVVTATFTASTGSPLDEDPMTASDVFDDLAGCDWDGSALHRDHFWYCEDGIGEGDVALVRSVFAEQAGIDPADVVLVDYR